jgi:hypothetical protein
VPLEAARAGREVRKPTSAGGPHPLVFSKRSRLLGRTGHHKFIKYIVVLWIADWHRFDADPDPNFLVDVDPYPDWHPTMQIHAKV